MEFIGTGPTFKQGNVITKGLFSPIKCLLPSENLAMWSALGPDTLTDTFATNMEKLEQGPSLLHKFLHAPWLQSLKLSGYASASQCRVLLQDRVAPSS